MPSRSNIHSARLAWPLLLVLLCAAPAAAGSLTMQNASEEHPYCATFDLWTASGTDRGELCAAAGSVTRHEAGFFEAYGKIAVYRQDDEGNLVEPPEARFNPDGMPLPSKNYRIDIAPDDAVRVQQTD